MKNLSFFHIPIAYLLLYTIMILATGIWLFLLSQGLNGSEGIVSTLQHIVASPESKSLHNLVEVATPHMFAMGMMIFVVAHFMLFSTKISQKTSLIVALILFTLALFNIVSYGAISFGFLMTGWVKLISMSLFVGMFLLLLGMVAFSL